MHKKHNSHHILILLGLLVLVFLLIFGIRYFKSEYSFGEQDVQIKNTQDYNDGIATENPFVSPAQEYLPVEESEQEIIPLTDPSIEDYIPGEE